MTDSGLQRKWKFRGLAEVGGTALCLAREMQRLHRCNMSESAKPVSEKRTTEPQKVGELPLIFLFGAGGWHRREASQGSDSLDPSCMLAKGQRKGNHDRFASSSSPPTGTLNSSPALFLLHAVCSCQATTMQAAAGPGQAGNKSKKLRRLQSGWVQQQSWEGQEACC